jgi:hypothetical protein
MNPVARPVQSPQSSLREAEIDTRLLRVAVTSTMEMRRNTTNGNSGLDYVLKLLAEILSDMQT